MNYVEQNIISPLIGGNDQQQLGELGRWFLSKLISGRDAYEKMNHGQVVDFLGKALKQSVRAVLVGTSKSVEDSMKEIMSKVHTKESWGTWVKERYTWKYFLPSMGQANAELRDAQTIILESKRSNATANKDLATATWSYVDKSLVKSLLAPPSQMNLTQSQSQAQAQASMGSGIVEWAKNNKTMAIGLSAATVAGLFYMVNKNKAETQKLN